MSNCIHHFIWGYQIHYRVHLQVLAEAVCKLLDERLRPDVFLVGIRPPGGATPFAACVEPEDEHWIQSDAFDQVLKRAGVLRTGYPESNLLQSHPLAQERADDALHRRSIRDAILEVVDQHPDRPEGAAFFASLPAQVGDYLVSVVVQLQSEILASYYSLSSGTVKIHEYREYDVSRSFIDSVIRELLTEAGDGLLRPDAGFRTSDRRGDDIMRSAAERFIRDLAFRADHGTMGTWHSFYHVCNELSSLTYESEVGRGTLLLAAKNHPAVLTRIAFSDSIAFRETRRVRKLLELASHGSELHTNTELVFGLVETGPAIVQDENIFSINFLGQHHWAVRHAGTVLLVVRAGKPSLPKRARYETKLLQDLPRIFPDISEDASQLLVSFVRQAELERHGTLLVICSQAAAEASRLRNQATTVAACPLTRELLSHLTGIDGAILLDPSGQCYAIGVILDGMASAQGDPARGARFNSAIRYIESARDRGIAALAVVLSEDGSVDIIPDLKPKIKRFVILEHIQRLEDVAEGPTVFTRLYNDAVKWLENHRFYLLAMDCVRTNAAIATIEARRQKEDPGGVRILRQEFVPDSAMDETLYYEHE